MKVLFIGSLPSPVTPILLASGCQVEETENPFDVQYLRTAAIDFVVSYRYRHILPAEVIRHLEGKIINLHISLLPWNRGADPNLWSFLDDTPKGCTIHYMDEGLDTGDIIAQQELTFSPTGETLATTYRKLDDAMLDLFTRTWPRLMAGKAGRKKQEPGGSIHRGKDKKKYESLLKENGWDTAISEIIGRNLSQEQKRRENGI